MWLKRKFKCSHDWHFVMESPMLTNNGIDVDSEYACYIFCPKCDSEKHVIVEEWNRISKQQEIKKKFQENKPNEK